MRRRAQRWFVLLALIVIVPACVSPFHDHAKDHHDAFARDAREAHRKYDRYFLNLDWDDPYHDWHDESFATGPGHRH